MYTSYLMISSLTLHKMLVFCCLLCMVQETYMYLLLLLLPLLPSLPASSANRSKRLTFRVQHLESICLLQNFMFFGIFLFPMIQLLDWARCACCDDTVAQAMICLVSAAVTNARIEIYARKNFLWYSQKDRLMFPGSLAGVLLLVIQEIC